MNFTGTVNNVCSEQESFQKIIHVKKFSCTYGNVFVKILGLIAGKLPHRVVFYAKVVLP